MLAEPVQIDGEIGAEEWAGALELSPLVDPLTGGPLPFATRIWVGQTADALILAVSSETPVEPIARTRQPNVQMDGEDVVTVFLDPFGKKAFSGQNSFTVNAFGAQQESLAGGRAAKREWRGDWQAAAKIRPGGYDIEFRIPWRLLDRPSGTADVQFNIARYDARSNRSGWWSNRTLQGRPDFDGFLTGIALPDPDAKSTVNYLGYISAEIDDKQSPKTSLTTGVDLRWRPNSQVTGLLSISPDFRNIEQQVQDIGFTRTERFQGDERPFFTEGSGRFNFGSGFSFGRMFYSRRIEDFDTGIKAFGDLNKSDQFGILATREDGRRTDAALSWSRRLDPRSSVQAYMTHTGLPGSSNTAFGGEVELSRGNWGAGAEGAAAEDGSAASAYAEYSIPRLFSIVRYIDVDSSFSPPLALIPWRGRSGAYNYTSWSNPATSGPLKNWGLEFFAEDYAKRGGGVQTRGASLDGYMLLRNDIRLAAGVSESRFEAEPERDINGSFTFNSSNSQRLIRIGLREGERGSDKFQAFSARANYRFGGSLDAGFSYDRESYRGIEDQAVLGLGWEKSAAESITARLVRRNGDLNAYLAYRRAGFKGLEWFFILGNPNTDRTASRAAIKVVWAG